MRAPRWLASGSSELRLRADGAGSVGAGPTFQYPVDLVELPEPRMISGLASLAMLALLAARRGELDSNPARSPAR
jgi:hypothetical protein